MEFLSKPRRPSHRCLGKQAEHNYSERHINK